MVIDAATKRDYVWNQGKMIPGYSYLVWRWDAFGRVIRYWDYGNRSSEWGWEIDHITPLSQGGTDDLNNLQPLHWMSNLERRE